MLAERSTPQCQRCRRLSARTFSYSSTMADVAERSGTDSESDDRPATAAKVTTVDRRQRLRRSRHLRRAVTEARRRRRRRTPETLAQLFVDDETRRCDVVVAARPTVESIEEEKEEVKEEASEEPAEEEPKKMTKISTTTSVTSVASVQLQQQKHGTLLSAQMTATAKSDTRRVIYKELYRLPLYDLFDVQLRKLLWKFSNLIMASPVLFVVIPLLATALSALGFVLRRDTLFSTESPPFELYFSKSPVQSQPTDYHPLFNVSNPRYDTAVRMSRLNYAVILRAKQGNILREEVIERYLSLRRRVEALKIADPTSSRVYKYSSICRGREMSDRCELDVVEFLMSRHTGFRLRFPEMQLVDPRNASANGSALFLGRTFGGVETDETGAMTRATALAMYFQLAKASEELLSPTEWDEEFQQLLDAETRRSPMVESWSEGSWMQRPMRDIQTRVSFWSFGAYLASMNREFAKIDRYLLLSAAIVFVLIVGCFLKFYNSYATQPWLGLSCVLVTFLSLASAYGIKVGTDGSVSSTLFSVVHFFIGISSLTSISLLRSWRKFSNIATDCGDKMRFICACELPFVLLSLLVIVAASIVAGVSSTVPLFRIVCELGTLCGLFLMVYFFLFFMAAFYLSGKREAAGVKWFMCWQEGDTKSSHRILHASFLFREMRKTQRKLLESKCTNVEKRIASMCGSVSPSAYIIFFLFCLYLLCAVWGCVQLQPSLAERDFLEPSDEVARFLDDYVDLYGENDRFLELVFEGNIDYSDADVQLSIDALLRIAEDANQAHRVVSWLREYARFARDSIYVINKSTFSPVLQQVFLSTPAFRRFSADVAFSTRITDKIVASRMYIELSKIGVDQQVGLIKSLLAQAQASQLILTIRAPSVFLLQHDVQIASATTAALSVLVCTLAVLSLLVFAQPLISLILLVQLAFIAVGSLGFGSLWAVPLNAPVVATLLAGLLYSFAQLFHLAYHFVNNSLATSRARLEYAFQSCFRASLEASLIVFFAALPLVACRSEFARQQLKFIVVHVANTAVHTLLFLPALLRIASIDLPTCCKGVQRRFVAHVKLVCGRVCGCCSSDEDASSIYYIPTNGHRVDPEFVQQFYQEKFREDILCSQQADPKVSPSMPRSEVESVNSATPADPVPPRAPSPKSPTPPPVEVEKVRQVYMPKKYRDPLIPGAVKRRNSIATPEALAISDDILDSEASLTTSRAVPSTAGRREGRRMTVVDIDIDRIYSKSVAAAAASATTAEPTTPIARVQRNGKETDRLFAPREAKKTAAEEKHDSQSLKTDSSKESVYALHTDENGNRELRKIASQSKTPAAKSTARAALKPKHSTVTASVRREYMTASQPRFSYAQPFMGEHFIQERITVATGFSAPRQADGTMFTIPVNPVIELRPEWKQTWLHGTFRQPMQPGSRPTIFSMANVQKEGQQPSAQVEAEKEPERRQNRRHRRNSELVTSADWHR